jgi:hypothetical protein
VHVGKGWEFGLPKSGKAMRFLRQRTPVTYGGLVDVGKASQKSVMLYQPILGLLGLEIQAGIYRFLHQCVKLIMHDESPIQFFIAPTQPKPAQLTVRKDKEEYRTLQDVALETPYVAPQELDLEAIKSLVASRRSSAEDHVWLLREDPGYFVDSLVEWKEHHPHTFNHNCHHCWLQTAGKMVSDSITSLVYWHRIYLRLKALPPLQEQIARAASASGRLVKGHEQLWAELDRIVFELFPSTPGVNLTGGVPVSPRMRHAYTLNSKSMDSINELWRSKHGRSEEEMRVDRVFYYLCDPASRDLHTLPRVVQEIQYILDTEPACAQLVDSWVNTQFADLAVISELQIRIDSLEPWASGWRTANVAEAKPAKKNLDDLQNMVDALSRCIEVACCKMMDIEDPTGPCWRYPVDKRPSQENTKLMRHAEFHLDLFWDELDCYVDEISAGQYQLYRTIKGRTLHHGEIHRTPPWVEPKAPKAKAADLEPVTPLRERDINSMHSHYHDSPSHNCISSTPRVKIKTRGTPREEPSDVASPETLSPSESAPPAPTQIVKVPRRDYKVFCALLPPPTSDFHQRSEISWDELLHAMESIGLQPEKLYGSVWIFKPLPGDACKVQVNRSIQFHEPKEVRKGSKIPSRMVRVLGRRLKYTYGWEPGMFGCE